MARIITGRPAVVAASGADGASFSFTSSLNLTTSTTQVFLGGKNGVLDSGTANASFFGSGLDSGFTNLGAGGQSPRFQTSTASIRKCSLNFDAAYYKAGNPSNSAAFGMGYDTGGAIVESYLAFVLQTTANVNLIASGTATLQNKLVRWHPIASIVDGDVPFVITSHWKNPPNVAYLASTNASSSQTTYFFDAGGRTDYPAFNTGDRYLCEFWLKPPSGSGTADGSFRVRWTSMSTGTVLIDNSITAINTYSDATRMRWAMIQSYFGNATPAPGSPGTANGTTTFEEPGDGANYLEEIYYNTGANAQATIKAGNASTFAACTKFIPQPMTDHTGTNRTITRNKPDASWTHLYEFDGSGTLVNSAGVAF